LVASLTNFAPRQFLERIVTADEIWAPHYEPEIKLRVWLVNARHHPWLRNSKVNHQPVRLCLLFFFFFVDMEGATLVHFTPKGETVNRLPYVRPSERGRFSSDEVIRAVKNWSKTRPKETFFLTELKNL
jgi:hypothetical protein